MAARNREFSLKTGILFSDDPPEIPQRITLCQGETLYAGVEDW